MSEIRVTSIVGENGGDRVGLTTGLTVIDWNDWYWCNNISSRSCIFSGIDCINNLVGNGAYSCNF